MYGNQKLAKRTVKIYKEIKCPFLIYFNYITLNSKERKKRRNIIIFCAHFL